MAGQTTEHDDSYTHFMRHVDGDFLERDVGRNRVGLLRSYTDEKALDSVVIDTSFKVHIRKQKLEEQRQADERVKKSILYRKQSTNLVNNTKTVAASRPSSSEREDTIGRLSILL